MSSYGIAELTPDDGRPIAALHVRVSLANLSDRDNWTLEVPNARLLRGDGVSFVPLFANSDVATLPIVRLDHGERSAIDLYFAMNVATLDPRDPGFTLSWPMNRPARGELRARFERPSDSLASADAAPELGRGAHWWADPSYPWPIFAHHDGYIVPRPPNHVVVSRPPSWESWKLDGQSQLDIAPSDTECEEW